MPLSKKEIDDLLRLVVLTNDREINCDQCLYEIAQFAEQQLAGKSITDTLREVEHHLAICEECREEYEILKQALRDLENQTNDGSN